MRGFAISLLACSVTMSAVALFYLAVTPLLAKRYSAKGRYYVWLIVVIGFVIPFRPQFGSSLINVTLPGDTGKATFVQTGNAPKEIAAMAVQTDNVQPAKTAMPAQPGNDEVAEVSALIEAENNIAAVKIPVQIENDTQDSTLATICKFVWNWAMLRIIGIFKTFSWWQLTVMIWAVGAAAFLAFHTVRYYRFVKMVGRWREPITAGEAYTILQELKTEMKITTSVRLFGCSCIGSPTLTGFVNPGILLPTTAWKREELCFILKHELVHLKRKDFLYKVLLLMAKAVHWFNPVVYLMGKAIDGLCEISCDAETVESADADTRRHYSETVIGVAQYQSKLNTALSTNFYGGKKGMKKRILSIMDMNKKKMGLVIIGMALMITLGSGFAFTVNAVSDKEELSVTESIAFSNETNAMQENVIFSANGEPSSEYEKFGISYDKEQKMLFGGEPVRYFWDGYEFETGIMATHYEYFNERGVVDVHTVRSVIDNGDGSVDMFGELLDIAADSQATFDARNIDALRNPPAASETIADTEINADYADKTMQAIAEATETNADNTGETIQTATEATETNTDITGNAMQTMAEAMESSTDYTVDHENTINEAAVTTADEVYTFVPPVELEKEYSIYNPFGVTYDKTKDRFYYNGKLVSYFLDIKSTNGERPGSGKFSGTMLSHSYGDGDIALKTIRDYTAPDNEGHGKLTGIAVIEKPIW